MKFKLDENLGTRTERVFFSHGHDVATVRMEGLQGAPDGTLFSVCRQEGRCLVTLDLDFSDVTRFPVEESCGLVVFRVPRNPTLSCLEELASRFLEACRQVSPEGKLFIVETGRIRIHDTD